MSIEAKHISYDIGKKRILKDITLTIPKNKTTVIIGPNGAGKSTFLRAVAGLINYGGDIFIDNVNIKDIPRKEFAKKIGVLFQHLEAPNDLTVEELAYYGRHPYQSFFGGEDEKTKRTAVINALKSAKVYHLKERKLGELSGGERQRANLAMVFSGTPDILLLDEPTTYLDISHQLEVMEIVRELNRENAITTIMVLHDLNHALKFSDFVIVMKDGEIVKSGEPNFILTKLTVSEVFGVDADILENKNGEKVIYPMRAARF